MWLSREFRQNGVGKSEGMRRQRIGRWNVKLIQDRRGSGEQTPEPLFHRCARAFRISSLNTSHLAPSPTMPKARESAST